MHVLADGTREHIGELVVLDTTDPLGLDGLVVDLSVEVTDMCGTVVGDSREVMLRFDEEQLLD